MSIPIRKKKCSGSEIICVYSSVIMHSPHTLKGAMSVRLYDRVHSMLLCVTCRCIEISGRLLYQVKVQSETRCLFWLHNGEACPTSVNVPCSEFFISIRGSADWESSTTFTDWHRTKNQSIALQLRIHTPQKMLKLSAFSMISWRIKSFYVTIFVYLLGLNKHSVDWP